MKQLLWLLVLLLTILFIFFAVSNRHIVILSLDPAPITIEAPLYSIVFTCIFVGLIGGGFIAWLKGFRWRNQLRNEQKVVRRLETELRLTKNVPPTSENGRKGIVKAA